MVGDYCREEKSLRYRNTGPLGANGGYGENKLWGKLASNGPTPKRCVGDPARERIKNGA